MLSIERVKELINDPSLSDKEIEEIRDELYILAGIILEKWRIDRAAGRLGRAQNQQMDKKPENTLPDCRENS